MPRAYLLDEVSRSQLWTSNYITTLLEKDLPALGISVPSETMRRLPFLLLNCSPDLAKY